MRIILISWPRVLGPCPAYGCVAASKCFGGCRDLAPMEARGRGPCSCGGHSLLMQHSTQHSTQCIAARQGQQRHTTRTQEHNTHQSNTRPRNAPSHGADKGAQMISAHNSRWWAPDAWAPPRLRVCGGIQVFGGYRDLAPVEECGRGPCSHGCHSLLI